MPRPIRRPAAHATRRAPLLALALLACASPTPPPVLDALFPDGRHTVALEVLVERAQLGPEEGFRLVEIGRDAHTSHHVVGIRGSEAPHRHHRHDLWVVMLRGHGHMQLGSALRPVGPGSVLYVPRGTAHAFHNESPEPAVAYAVYAPAFDGTDRTPVK